MDFQKELNDHSLTPAELVAWTNPGCNARAAHATRIESLLARIEHAKGPRAKYARHHFKAELAYVHKRIALDEPFEDARAQARAVFTAAHEDCTEAERVLAQATTESDQDCGELALKKARRALAAARAELVATLQAAPPPDVTGGLSDPSRELYELRAETEALVRQTSSPARAIEIAQILGVKASLGMLPLFALAEIDFTDSDRARRLLNLSWLTACRRLGVECPSDLELPIAQGESAAVG